MQRMQEQTKRTCGNIVMLRMSRHTLQIISSQWNEVTEEPVLSSVVVMTVDTTNAVIKVRNDFVVLGICANHTAPQSVTITEIVRFTSKDSQSSSIDTLVRHVATDEKSVHFSDLCDD